MGARHPGIRSRARNGPLVFSSLLPRWANARKTGGTRQSPRILPPGHRRDARSPCLGRTPSRTEYTGRVGESVRCFALLLSLALTALPALPQAAPPVRPPVRRAKVIKIGRAHV